MFMVVIPQTDYVFFIGIVSITIFSKLNLGIFQVSSCPRIFSVVKVVGSHEFEVIKKDHDYVRTGLFEKRFFTQKIGSLGGLLQAW